MMMSPAAQKKLAAAVTYEMKQQMVPARASFTPR